MVDIHGMLNENNIKTTCKMRDSLKKKRTIYNKSPENIWKDIPKY